MPTTPSKADQVAESEARARAGADPTLNAEAAIGSEGDAGPLDPGGTPRAAPGETDRAAPPPVRATFDNKRAAIIDRFRTSRREQPSVEQDEISDFTQSGAPMDVEQEQPEAVLAPEPEVVVEREVVVEQPALPPKIKLKVRGQETEYTLEDVIAKAQIALAADNYLDEARTKLKEVDDLVRNTRQTVERVDRPDQHQVRQPNAQDQTEVQAQPGEDGTDPNTPDDLTKLIEAMQFGDPNDAKQFLRNTIAREATQIVQQTLLNQRYADEGARGDKVLKDFSSQHADIAKDPKARAAVEVEIVSLQQQDIEALGVDVSKLRPDGLPPTPGDIANAHRWYRSNGHDVRSTQDLLELGVKSYNEWRGIKTADPAPAVPAKVIEKTAPIVEVTVDRTARRQAVQQQPSQSSIRPATPQQQAPAKPRDRSDIVADMKLRTKGHLRSGGAAVVAR